MLLSIAAIRASCCALPRGEPKRGKARLIDHLAEALFLQLCFLVAITATLDHLRDRCLNVTFILDIDTLVELSVCVLFELVRDFWHL